MSGKNLRVNLVANTSQFKSAMAQTSNQIKLLNSEFRSAAAETDKYGNKLDSTGAKKKQLNGVIEQYRLRIKAIKDEQKHWTNELKKGNITEEQHAQKQQELARRLNNTEAEMKRYEGQLKRLNVEGKRTTMTYAEFDKKFRDVGRTMRNVSAQVGITAGIGFMAMKRVLGDVVEEAMTFQAGMSEVQAISGATGKEIEMLTNQAKDLGKQTVFTSQQASEAMANLARAGFKVNEIYDAMPGMLDLAASSKLDLGTAANITSNIIRTFGFEANKAGKVADVLAKGAATANIDVQGLGESMKTAGPVAKSLGIEFESVASATGIMADAGIEGSQAGRMLRQGMLRLSKPTGEAAKLIKKMGIEVFDADGNMKSLDKVVAELTKGLKGQTKQQQAAALATIFGSESTAGWTVLLDKGAKELEKYTKELENSEGAAKDMANTMQDNAQGAIIRMQSALSGLKIELGEKLLPTLGKGADLVSDFANNLSEMDEATIQTVAETALLVTAILGVTTAVAGLTAGIGAFMAFAGPVGLAITAGTALLAGFGMAIYKASLEAENAKKVNLDLANSLSDQAIELEKNVSTFDKLSKKANISNAELAELYDLNQRIANAKNSDEIAKLQAQYDKLAEKSGLSKDELQQLFSANKHIIEQSPDVEKSISEQGNAFVETTESVKEYINSLYEASRVELEAQREKQLKREEELMKQINKEQRQLNDAVEALSLADEIRKMSQEEIFDLQQNIVDSMNDTVSGSEEWHGLNEKLKIIQEALNGNAEDYYLTQADIVSEKREAVSETQKELDEINALNGALADVWLKQAGITEEGEKGLIALEEKLAKNEEQLANLDQQLEKNGKLTQEEQEQYDKLIAQNEELSYTQEYLNNELELYGSVNSLVESKKHLLSDATQEKIKELEKTHEIEVAEGNIITQLQEKQSQLVKERDQLEENRQKQGANKEEIDKQIAAIDEKIDKGDEAIVSILKELDVLELVKDGIELNSSELENFLVGLGYTVDEAAELARVLVGDTVAEMEDGAERAKEAGKNTGKSHADGINSTKGDNEKSAKDISDLVDDRFSLGKDKSNKHGKDKGEAHNKGIGSTRGANIRTTQDIVRDLLGEMGKGDADAQSSGKNKGTAHSKGVGSTKASNLTASNLIRNTVTSTLGRTTDGGGGSRAGTMFASGIRGRSGSASSAGSTVAKSGERGLRSVRTASAGTAFVSGFRNSISSGGGSVWTAAWNLGKSALSALKRSIDSHSPSRLTRQEGINFTDGFALAIDDGTKEAIKKSKEMGKQTIGALSDEVNQYKHSFAKVALGIEQNKQTLVVEHKLDNKFNDLIQMFKSSNDNQPLKDLLNATLQQNQILMQLLQKDFKAEVAFESVYQPIKKRLNEDQYSQYKQRRR